MGTTNLQTWLEILPAFFSPLLFGCPNLRGILGSPLIPKKTHSTSFEGWTSPIPSRHVFSSKKKTPQDRRFQFPLCLHLPDLQSTASKKKQRQTPRYLLICCCCFFVTLSTFIHKTKHGEAGLSKKKWGFECWLTFFDGHFYLKTMILSMVKWHLKKTTKKLLWQRHGMLTTHS